MFGDSLGSDEGAEVGSLEGASNGTKYGTLDANHLHSDQLIVACLTLIHVIKSAHPIGMIGTTLGGTDKVKVELGHGTELGSLNGSLDGSNDVIRYF